MTLATRESRGWKPWSVGCHWSRGDYSISTITQGDRSGYVLYRTGGHVIAEFVTWDEAERLADRRRP